LNKSVIAYPPILEKHFETRTTYIRNGSSFFMKKDSYEGNGENPSSEKNCKVDMPKPKVEITVIHSGNTYLRTISGDGEVFDEVTPLPTLPYEMNDDLSLYPNRTKKGGIAMRCTDTFSGTLSCIYDDGRGGTLLGDGIPKKPLEIVVDTSQLPGLPKGVLTMTEVVSLQVNTKIDPNTFVLAPRSK
jgi:hypothetical protein